jgi:hypothetical protein
MKVFISWSGERSRLLAESLRDWLPTVIQSVEPFLSKADIHKGSRWGVELSSILEQSKLGIICLTPDNLNKPWILFEAGALSKTLPDSLVCPLLFNLDPSDVVGPLEQFQATILNKEDVRELIRTINYAQKEEALSPDLLEKAFELAWPEFKERVSKIPDVPLADRYDRSTHDIVREILERIRAEQRESETRETDFYKSRDSFFSFLVKLLPAALQSGSTLPADLANDLQTWSVHTASFLETHAVPDCPDCLGTGWTIVPNIGAQRCEHKSSSLPKNAETNKL